ncbi:hypothetical protein KHA80_11300 [Anaerobacillus sp. HL2]|nr:hypothetical protein KHA80_11300 [Anaerobacillus sp. HL2]
MVEIEGEFDEVLTEIEQKLQTSKVRKMYQTLYSGFSLQLLKKDIALFLMT